MSATIVPETALPIRNIVEAHARLCVLYRGQQVTGQLAPLLVWAKLRRFHTGDQARPAAPIGTTQAWRCQEVAAGSGRPAAGVLRNVDPRGACSAAADRAFTRCRCARPDQFNVVSLMVFSAPA
jgi:hypothetical protein